MIQTIHDQAVKYFLGVDPFDSKGKGSIVGVGVRSNNDAFYTLWKGRSFDDNFKKILSFYEAVDLSKFPFTQK